MVSLGHLKVSLANSLYVSGSHHLDLAMDRLWWGWQRLKLLVDRTRTKEAGNPLEPIRVTKAYSKMVSNIESSKKYLPFNSFFRWWLVADSYLFYHLTTVLCRNCVPLVRFWQQPKLQNHAAWYKLLQCNNDSCHFDRFVLPATRQIAFGLKFHRRHPGSTWNH